MKELEELIKTREADIDWFKEVKRPLDVKLAEHELRLLNVIREKFDRYHGISGEFREGGDENL